jgi:hypothetical protein
LFDQANLNVAQVPSPSSLEISSFLQLIKVNIGSF